MSVFKKTMSLFSSDWVFVLFFSTLLIAAAFTPFIYQTIDTPKDSVFMGTHNNALDFPMFISEIIQSQRGRWTFLAKFTSEDQPGTLVHIIYLPLGKIATLLNLPPIFTYHLARILFGYTLAFAIFYFIRAVFPSPTEKIIRKIAFLLTLFSAGFVKWDFTNGIAIKNIYLDFWSGADVFKRAVFQPHAMVKNTLLLLILIWMGKLLTCEKPNKIYLLYSCLGALLLGLLDPMNTITILLLLGGYVGYKIIIHITNIKRFIPQALYFILYTFTALSALIYTTWVFANTPWRAVRDWEATQFITVPFWDYANHLGITFYLGVIGLIFLIWKKRNIYAYYLAILTIFPPIFITSGISQKFSLSILRFFQTPVYIFLAIGTAYLIYKIATYFHFKFPMLNTGFILYTAYFILITFSIPTYIFSMRQQLEEYTPHFWNIYPEKNYYAGLVWLKENIPLDAVVFSNPMGGNLIPAVSGNTVYLGHPVSTIKYQEKLEIAKKFLAGGMNSTEALKLIKTGRIDFLLLSWGEQYRIDAKNYPFLQKIFENETLAIYKVNNPINLN